MHRSRISFLIFSALAIISLSFVSTSYAGTAGFDQFERTSITFDFQHVAKQIVAMPAAEPASVDKPAIGTVHDIAFHVANQVGQSWRAAATVAPYSRLDPGRLLI
jgi:hypothetical protein